MRCRPEGKVCPFLQLTTRRPWRIRRAARIRRTSVPLIRHGARDCHRAWMHVDPGYRELGGAHCDEREKDGVLWRCGAGSFGPPRPWLTVLMAPRQCNHSAQTTKCVVMVRTCVPVPFKAVLRLRR